MPQVCRLHMRTDFRTYILMRRVRHVEQLAWRD